MDNIGALIVPAVIALVAISIVAKGVRVVQQAQTMIIERLGRYHRTLSSGVNLIIPIIDKPRAIDWHQVIVTPAGDSFARHFRTEKIDLRETVYVFPRQNVITKDNVVVEIDALIYSQITDPVRATYEIANLPDAIEKLTQTTLRNVIGEMELDHILSSRDTINAKLRAILDEATHKWGSKVSRVELKDINPPRDIRDAMEKQMRAERERRATIITADAERQSRILAGEGIRQAEIKTAEGEKKAKILDAQPEAAARPQGAVRDFAESEVRPRVCAMEQAAQLDPTLTPKFFELGLMGIEIPEAHGGAGGSLFMTVLAVEELSAVDASAAIFVDVQNTLVNALLLKWASDDIKRRYLPRLASEVVGAYALSEAGSGSDAFGLQTKATRQGDKWILDGRKLWITNGAEAGVYVIFANTDFAKGYKGITAFAVERGFKGFSVGKKEDKLGIRASSTCELILDGCEVPAANVVGEVGIGYKVAIETLNTGRIGIGAQMIGVARGALTAALKYAKERKQFGKPIRDFQAVQFQLAQAATELEAARLMVYNAARLEAAGEPNCFRSF